MKRSVKLTTMLLFSAVGALSPGVALAQTVVPVEEPFSATAIVSTIFYGLLGLALYLLSYVAFDKLMKLDLRRELVEDQNESIGIMMAGVFIGIAIIIAAAMTG